MPSDKDEARISTHQMRQLHALLRDHGVAGDKAVHAYLAAWLAEHDHEPVESRTELTTTLAAQIIAELSDAEVAHVATDARLAELRKPFAEAEVGKLPRSTCKACSDSREGTCDRHPQKARCSICQNWHNTQSAMHIDFVGHADVTARLLEVDPGWSWRPFTTEEVQALAPVLRDGGLWIMLTVLGVTRPGFGDADGKRGGNAVKEMIGDALRNAAMRFGVALDLWAKGDREWANAEKHGAESAHPDSAPPREQHGEQPYDGPGVEELVARLCAHAERAGTTYEAMTAKFRADRGNLTLDQMERLPTREVAALEASVSAWLAANPPPTTPAG